MLFQDEKSLFALSLLKFYGSTAAPLVFIISSVLRTKEFGKNKKAYESEELCGLHGPSQSKGRISRPLWETCDLKALRELQGQLQGLNSLLNSLNKEPKGFGQQLQDLKRCR